MENLYFVAGIPRSGSTLLQNVLAQNPQFHCTPTSVLSELMLNVKNNWHGLPLTRNLSEELSYSKLRGILAGMMDGYFADVKEPFVFDKGRAWPNLIETLLEMGREPKIIATVRDVREVVASFEKIYNKSLALGAPSQLLVDPITMQNPDSRLEYWISSKSPLGASFNTLLNAFRTGHTERIHLVRFEDFTTYPMQTLHGIYEFLELESFEHDVKNVKQTIFEDDRSHGFRDLHKIREGAILPVKPSWQNILPSTFAEKVAGSNFWNGVQ